MGRHTDTRRIRDAERRAAQPGKLFFLAATVCVWKLFSKKPHRISNAKWLNAGIVLFGIAFLIDFVGLVFSLI